MGLPGTRMPHVWLDNEKKLSTLDLINGQFLLIQQNHDQSKETRLAGICNRLNIPLQIVTLNNYPNAIATWNSYMKYIHDKELLLVRPDGFIAWRGVENDQTDLEAIIKNCYTLK